MSADNHYVVKFDMKRGGYVVRMGFASDSLPVFVRGDETLFSTHEAAVQEAHRRNGEDPAEYGVSGEDHDAYFGICYPDEYREWATALIAKHKQNLEWLDDPEWDE